MKKLFFILSILLIAGYIIAQGPGIMRYSFESDFGYGYCGGYGHRWTQRNLPMEYYKKFEDMINKNREKIEKLYEEKYDISSQIRNELDKRNPDWKYVEKMISEQKNISDKIWNIMKNEHITIYRNLPYEERKMLNNTFQRNYRQDYRHHMR